MDEKLKDMIIIFKHQGKCGGTSLRNSIHEAQIFKPEEILYMYGWHASKEGVDRKTRSVFHEECMQVIYGELTFKDLFVKVNKELDSGVIKFVYGHFIPPVSSDVKDTINHPCHLVTMLRHPYTKMVSLYNYRRKGGGMPATLDFEEWISMTIGDAFIDGYDNSLVESYSKYDKILFYEEYKDGLDYMSGILGKQLIEHRDNVSNRYVERSSETDKLIELHRPQMIRNYESARRLWMKS